MEQFKKLWTKENILLLSIFIFFFCICLFAPLVGDDWKNYIISSKGMNAIIDGTKSMYMTWEGRIGSRFLIYLLTSHKIIFDLVVAILTTSMIYFVGHLVRIQSRYRVYLLSFLAILLCSRTIFMELYLYVAGSITYLFPTVLLIGYLYYYVTILSKKSSTLYGKILCIIIALILPTFVEHIGITFVLINLVLFLYQSYQNKKIDYFFLIIFILSLLSCLVVLLSPGTNLRNTVDGNQLSMVATILHNYRNFIYYTFTINVFLIILLNGVYVYFINHYFHRKVIKILSSLFVLIPSITIIILQTLHDFEVISIYLQDNKLVICYFVMYSIGLILLFLKQVKDKTYYLLLLAAILPNLAMMASPIWGGRTTATTVFITSLLCILLIDKYAVFAKEKIVNTFLTIITITICSFYLIGYYNLNQLSQLQKKTIEENKDSICIYDVPKQLISGLVPTDEYHITTYKEYYQIPETTKLKLCDGNWKYVIFR